MFLKNKKEKTFILRLLRAAHDGIKFHSDYEILMALNKLLIIFGKYNINIFWWQPSMRYRFWLYKQLLFFECLTND
jgi:hypothetical protein